MATQIFESRGIRDEAKTVGTGGAVGAIIGGIIGGLKGAVIGAAVGAGGVIVATEGKDVTLEQGTILRVRLDEPLQIN
jgi:outer membrane lipoprotein SlyB